jgi:hypothetical protein
VPYPAINHGDGTKNHGYVCIKGNLTAVSNLPEVQGWPELQRFLEAINSAESPIESVGCEKGYFPAELPNVPPVVLGSYIDVIFTDASLNDESANHLLLAKHFVQQFRTVRSGGPTFRSSYSGISSS